MHDLEGLHTSRLAAVQQVIARHSATPTFSLVLSLTSPKASTMMASRKLSSTMNTNSMYDQKKRVPAAPCGPKMGRACAFVKGGHA
jgi:hypothetical protein